MSQSDGYPFSNPPPGVNEVKQMYQKNSGWLKILIIIALIVIVGTTCWYQVGTDEVAVVTRFGKYSDTYGPGLRFKIPLVDQIIKIKAKRQLKEEFGFVTEEAGVKSAFRRDATTRKESTMLTGDLNVAVVEWIVHFKIADPKQYAFKVRNVRGTLRALSQAAMRSVVGDYSVTEVLTTGREEILENARIKLSEMCKLYETGIAIQRIELKDSAPPEPVRPSFNEVNQAEQERDRLQNEAWAQYNSEIPKARGEAKKLIQQARGYATARENRALGDAERFLSVEKEYSRAPKVTRARLYLETMTEILPKAGKKVLMDKEANGVMPLLFPAQTGAKPLAGGVQ